MNPNSVASICVAAVLCTALLSCTPNKRELDAETAKAVIASCEKANMVGQVRVTSGEIIAHCQQPAK
jgi:hypothetical protein